jgi:hypothetical protein
MLMGALCRALRNPNNKGESKDTLVEKKFEYFFFNEFYYLDVHIQYLMLIEKMKRKKNYVKH